MFDLELGMWLLFSLFTPFYMQNKDESRAIENAENDGAQGQRDCENFWKDTFTSAITRFLLIPA